jgi:hypothetical protein
MQAKVSELTKRELDGVVAAIKQGDVMVVREGDDVFLRWNDR